MMRSVYIVLAIVQLLKIRESCARPDGAPLSACSSLTPGHGFPLVGNTPFQIGVKQVSKDELQITISSSDNTAFQGFILQARKVGETTPVGRFSNPPALTHTINCRKDQDTVTHKNTISKTSLEFTWNPPVNFTGTIRFSATVAIDFSNYWKGIVSEEISLPLSNGAQESPGVSSVTQTLLQPSTTVFLSQTAATSPRLTKTPSISETLQQAPFSALVNDSAGSSQTASQVSLSPVTDIDSNLLLTTTVQQLLNSVTMPVSPSALATGSSPIASQVKASQVRSETDQMSLVSTFTQLQQTQSQIVKETAPVGLSSTSQQSKLQPEPTMSQTRVLSSERVQQQNASATSEEPTSSILGDSSSASQTSLHLSQVVRQSTSTMLDPSQTPLETAQQLSLTIQARGSSSVTVKESTPEIEESSTLAPKSSQFLPQPTSQIPSETAQQPSLTIQAHGSSSVIVKESTPVVKVSFTLGLKSTPQATTSQVEASTPRAPQSPTLVESPSASQTPSESQTPPVVESPLVAQTLSVSQTPSLAESPSVAILPISQTSSLVKSRTVAIFPILSQSPALPQSPSLVESPLVAQTSPISQSPPLAESPSVAKTSRESQSLSPAESPSVALTPSVSQSLSLVESQSVTILPLLSQSLLLSQSPSLLDSSLVIQTPSGFQSPSPAKSPSVALTPSVSQSLPFVESLSVVMLPSLSQSPSLAESSSLVEKSSIDQLFSTSTSIPFSPLIPQTTPIPAPISSSPYSPILSTIEMSPITRPSSFIPQLSSVNQTLVTTESLQTSANQLSSVVLTNTSIPFSPSIPQATSIPVPISSSSHSPLSSTIEMSLVTRPSSFIPQLSSVNQTLVTTEPLQTTANESGSVVVKPTLNQSTGTVQPTLNQSGSISPTQTKILQSTSQIDLTTTQPPTQGTVNAIVSFSIMRNFDEKLKNKESQEYRDLTNTIENEVESVYRKNSIEVEVTVQSLRPGSIIAVLLIVFQNQTQLPDLPLQPLNAAISENKLGNLSVDPNSLTLRFDECEPKCHQNATCAKSSTSVSFSCKCNPSLTGDGVKCTEIKEEHEDDDDEEIKDLLIASLVIVSIILLIVLLMFMCLLCRICKNK